MSANFSLFAVDLDRVRGVVGSKNRKLLPELKERFDSWFENVDEQLEDSNRGPPLEAVLKLIIAGKPVDPVCSLQFAVAVELLYRHFAVDLPGMNWRSMSPTWAGQVDEAIKRSGVSDQQFGFIKHLFERGPIIPFDVEFSMGYLELEEVRSAKQAFDRADFTRLEMDERIAVAEVRCWLVTCETLGLDLASFDAEGY